MKIITNEQIIGLVISPKTCVEWVKESFMFKQKAQLPAKISLHPQGNDFFNTMPCILPEPYNIFCLKEVYRIREAVPALVSDIWLYNSQTGDLLAMMDGNWITAMRTGAVATLAAKLFRKQNANTYGLFGLGNTARATILCLLESEPDIHHKILLLKYKNQAELFIERFNSYGNVSFEVFDSAEAIIRASDVVFSCVTETEDLFCENDEAFPKGCLIIPVHTRGFQNCDLFFDKIFADDINHIKGFRYFNRFKQLCELDEVMRNPSLGRTNDEERILSYNIGIGLHDAIFATKIYSLLESNNEDLILKRETRKFWV